MAINPVRLNHAVFYVADLERSVAFYTEVFGMEIAASEPRMSAAFLRLPRSGNHHDLGLFGIGSNVAPKGRGLGLYHLAWQVDEITDLEIARDLLTATGAYTGESDHGATKSVYGKDPDDNEFEIMWMLPIEKWGEFDDLAPVLPLDLPAAINAWGGVRTAGRIVTEASA
ncbi:MAG: VOC family protein [Knoellia sp.]